MRPQDGAGSDKVGEIDAAAPNSPGVTLGAGQTELCAVSLPQRSAGGRRGLPADALVCLPLTSSTTAKLLYDLACETQLSLPSEASSGWHVPADLNWRCFCRAARADASERIEGPVWRLLGDRLLRIQVSRADARAFEQANSRHVTFLQHWCEVAPGLVGDHQTQCLAARFAAELVTVAIPQVEGDVWALDMPSLTDLPNVWPPEIPGATREVLSRVVASFYDRWPDSSEFAPQASMQERAEEAVLPVALESLLQRMSRLDRLQTRFDKELEQAKLRAMKELAYGASHEINNPLANISSRAQILLRSETDASRRHALATINRQAFRAHEMIADLMLFAKPPGLQSEEMAAGELFQACVERARKALIDEYPAILEIPLETTWATLDDPVQADPVQLTVAVKAILANAVDSLEGSQGRIMIRSSRLPATNQDDVAWVELSLQDTGPGIDPRAREHLFDPFFSGREAGRGLGFGLSKVWRIMELHGGRVTVTSDAGKGTTVLLSLPVCRSDHSPSSPAGSQPSADA